jgi:hypothetical protein
VNVGNGPLFKLPGMPESVYQNPIWFGSAFDSTYGLAKDVMAKYIDSFNLASTKPENLLIHLQRWLM